MSTYSRVKAFDERDREFTWRSEHYGGYVLAVSAGQLMAKPTLVENRIRALRNEHNELTQAELAERVGVTRQTLNAIEQAKYSPSLEVAFRIAQVFDVPLDDVFSYHG